MKNIVVLTGAGISAESGIKTFRDSDGLWESHKVEDVATYDAWLRNPFLVLEFYNQRRRQLLDVKPNLAHFGLKKLEEKYNVNIITQNVDDLHERAGSRNILHLHGELKKSRSTFEDSLVYDIAGSELNIGDMCELGSQLRPHIVWFGEAVPLIEEAILITQKANILIVIGTSMNVYPAANLINYVKPNTDVYFIDPKANEIINNKNIKTIAKLATDGVSELLDILIN
ncbi:MAG: NAD-dependent protein deacylase [Bacteroidetes bacterium GWE2_29_8]|nr:MAG: NAD-dependent protein deacylase [Bacteroidetes bacterium GWE2_29_8]OFY20638.1 MAG: NAD-dependent protein deacylase [Bacteroidetes bacterium GWF2_29_10]